MDFKTHQFVYGSRADRESVDILKPKYEVAHSQENIRNAPLHDLNTMNELLLDINLDERKLLELGYNYIGKDDSRLPLISYEKKVFSYPIIAEKDDFTQVEAWIVADFSQRGVVIYRETLNNTVIDTIAQGEQFEMAWLQDFSQSTKIVKSRPMWMYPELFQLPSEEVWPKRTDKFIPKVMVIGDPYQACDREGFTLVEYEYAEEIIPPILKPILFASSTGESISRERISLWFRDLYHEDINALERFYGPYTPYKDNPYSQFVEKCFELSGDVVEAMLSGSNPEILHALFLKFKQIGARLMDGSWTFEDGKFLVGKDEISEELGRFFSYKQEQLMNNGNPEKWEDFSRIWSTYLENLDFDYISTRVPEYEKKLAKVRYWLHELPTTKSPDRITVGIAALNAFYDEMLEHYDYYDSSTHFLRSYDVDDSFDQNGDGAFGYFLPGYPISLRNKKTLQQALLRVEQMFEYSSTFLPLIQAEKERLLKSGIPLSEETVFQYFYSLERAWAKQHFFHKQTQKAVPIHGFFPHDMPVSEPQDRIIALTSVTMHGWNYLDRAGFEKDITAALPFVKVGGKYILGPINQAVYFHKPGDDFNAEALNEVLSNLKDQGLIDYIFVKGTRNHGDGDRDEEFFSENPYILEQNESAHSLVITRLK